MFIEIYYRISTSCFISFFTSQIATSWLKYFAFPFPIDAILTLINITRHDFLCWSINGLSVTHMVSIPFGYQYVSLNQAIELPFGGLLTLFKMADEILEMFTPLWVYITVIPRNLCSANQFQLRQNSSHLHTTFSLPWPKEVHIHLMPYKCIPDYK